MLGMIISRADSTFLGLGSRSRSLWLSLRELCNGSSAFIFLWILILFHTNVQYDSISSKLDFHGVWDQGQGCKIPQYSVCPHKLVLCEGICIACDALLL